MNMTLSQKQALQTFLGTGYVVASVSYDPSVETTENPYQNATDAGWTQYSTISPQSSTNLNEALYTMEL